MLASEEGVLRGVSYKSLQLMRKNRPWVSLWLYVPFLVILKKIHEVLSQGYINQNSYLSLSSYKEWNSLKKM